MRIHVLGLTEHIPPERWGRDHTTTLLYAETCAVDYHGFLDGAKMRTGSNYPTRLDNGDEVEGHTDYDCLTDAAAAGMLKQHPTEDEPGKQIIFTAKGWKYVHKLRRERAEQGLEEPISESAKRKYESGGTKIPVMS